MMMSPAVRKFTYTPHITSSVGWIGAVLVFIALAALALTSQNEATVRGAYLVMAPAAWFALVPLAHASLLTGIVLSLGTTWGLIRHYWVVLKLGITVFCTVILMIYMGTFRQMAGIAADPIVDLDTVRNASPLLHAGMALMLLLATTVLGVYKPFGMTPYGLRKQATSGLPLGLRASAQVSAVAGKSAPTYAFVVVALVLLVLFVLLHLASARFGH